jgi:hypothetical protein
MLNVQTKISLFVLIIFANWLIRAETTSADIFAERSAKGNQLKATTLSFSLRNTVNNRQLSSLFVTDGLQVEGFDVKGFRIKKDGKMSFKYSLKPKKMDGDDALCEKLTFQALLNGQEKYKGKLFEFAYDSLLTDQGKDNWVVFVGLEEDSSALQNKICNFEFTIHSFRNVPDEKQLGFYAKKSLTNTLTSGNW